MITALGIFLSIMLLTLAILGYILCAMLVHLLVTELYDNLIYPKSKRKLKDTKMYRWIYLFLCMFSPIVIFPLGLFALFSLIYEVVTSYFDGF